MIERIKNYFMKTFKYDFDFEFYKDLQTICYSFSVFYLGLLSMFIAIKYCSIFVGVFGACLTGLVFLYLIGWWAVEKERKATWKGEKTMEMGEANRRSNEWEKAYPILNFLQSCYYEIGRKKDIPEDTYYNIKYFIQRGKKGYSCRDVWGFYEYLTDVIVGGLKELQGMVHGYPSGITNSQAIDTDGESKGTKEWKKIIGKIIWTFEAIKKIENHEWVLVEDESKRKELINYVRRLNKSDKDKKRLFDDLLPHKWHHMTRQEMKKYHEGWALLKKYFMSLWD
jgi:hypothetical protein